MPNHKINKRKISKVSKPEYRKSKRLSIAKRIDTPNNGFNWDEKGRVELSKSIKEKTNIVKKFYANRKCNRDSAYNEVEENIFVAPVSVLQEPSCDYPVYGVFAKEEIINVRLGEYQGRVFDITENSEDEANSTYSFNLGNGKELRAEDGGSWPQLINSTLSPEAANVYYEKEGNSIVCYRKKQIKAGQQLLGFYNENYPFDANRMRFLHVSDNWQSSEERFTAFLDCYLADENDKYVIPNIDELTEDTIDLPVLEKSEDKLLPQVNQQNMSLLIYSCLIEDFELLEFVLLKKPDLLMQMRISGNSALHILFLKESLSTELKIKFATSIFKNANFTPLLLQNKAKDTILHIAIRQKNKKLIQFVLEMQEKKNEVQANEEKKRFNDVKYYMDAKGYDGITAAIATGDKEVWLAIKPDIKPGDMNYIFEENFDALCQAWQVLSETYGNEMLNWYKDLFLFTNTQRDMIETFEREVLKFTSQQNIIIPEVNQRFHLEGVVKGEEIQLFLKEMVKGLWVMVEQHEHYPSNLIDKLETAAIMVGAVIRGFDDEPYFNEQQSYPMNIKSLEFSKIIHKNFQELYSCLSNLEKLKKIKWSNLNGILNDAYETLMEASLLFIKLKIMPESNDKEDDNKMSVANILCDIGFMPNSNSSNNDALKKSEKLNGGMDVKP